MKKTAVILSEAIDKNNLRKDQIDTLMQVDLVYEVLTDLNYEVFKLKFDLNLEKLSEEIKKINPEFVFNLVEEESFIVLAPLFLETTGIPYTGCCSTLIQITNDKVLFKKLFKLILKKVGINLPLYIDENYNACFIQDKKYIIKSKNFHSSFHINENSVVSPASSEELSEILKSSKQKTGADFFAEEFINGREFNISVLNGEVFPAAEIEFINFTQNKPKIVCYDAKWNESSFMYNNTPRKLDFEEKDDDLIKRLNLLSKYCIEALQIDSYARLDYRVDADENIYLLEINCNPCLSKDAGFFASIQKKGFNYQEMIDKIINKAILRKQ